MKTISKLLFADTAPTRALLVFASIVWAFVLAAPGDNLLGSSYQRMLWAAPEPVWTILFVAYAAALWNRIVHDGENPRIELAVNTMGVLLYSTTATAAILGGGGLIGASAPQLALAASALWVFARSAECQGLRNVRDV